MRAITAPLEAKLTSLEVKVTALEVKTTALEQKMSNGTATGDEDSIIPPQRDLPPPQGFPCTVIELRNLVIGPHLIAIENYYGLVHSGSLFVRKNRVRRAYGLSIAM
jgi:hypothetical protein